MPQVKFLKLEVLEGGRCPAAHGRERRRCVDYRFVIGLFKFPLWAAVRNYFVLIGVRALLAFLSSPLCGRRFVVISSLLAFARYWRF